MGEKARGGPEETEEVSPGIYTVPSRVSQWGGRPMDRMRLSNSRGSDLQMSESGVITCAMGGHHLV